jgi:hypothetical protein
MYKSATTEMLTTITLAQTEMPTNGLQKAEKIINSRKFQNKIAAVFEQENRVHIEPSCLAFRDLWGTSLRNNMRFYLPY